MGEEVFVGEPLVEAVSSLPGFGPEEQVSPPFRELGSLLGSIKEGRKKGLNRSFLEAERRVLAILEGASRHR